MHEVVDHAHLLCEFICDILMITMIDESTNYIDYTDIMKRTNRPNFQRRCRRAIYRYEID